MLLTLAMIVCLQTPKTGQTPKPKTLMPIANYSEKVGDDAQLYSRDKSGKLRDVVIGKDEVEMAKLAMAIEARDEAKITKLKELKGVDTLPSGIEVTIIGSAGSVPQIISSGGVTVRVMNPTVWRVRFLDGQYKDQEMFVSLGNVEKCTLVEVRNGKIVQKKSGKK